MLIAPGNRHMTLCCKGSSHVVEIKDGPAVHRLIDRSQEQIEMMAEGGPAERQIVADDEQIG